jgi:hypothetical protein
MHAVRTKPEEEARLFALPWFMGVIGAIKLFSPLQCKLTVHA